MKFVGILILAIVLHLSLVYSKKQSLSDWLNQTIDGPGKVAEKVELFFT
jgi:hypothetical protein